ncbi:MAG TPA: hypothetical protein VL990_12475 [Acidobacteriaceae bacterium]|nr:hypothetical protein [Acidobacteriaceae bacterium]
MGISAWADDPHYQQVATETGRSARKTGGGDGTEVTTRTDVENRGPQCAAEGY